jgi:cyanophycinase-like exopeptidase
MPAGPIALFGSGETSRRGRQVHSELLRRLPSPVRIAILETPAGFQPNVAVVSGKLRAFFEQSLNGFNPVMTIIPARQRGGVFDPDSPVIAAPIAEAHYIFAGPGSPTFTVRHLKQTHTFELMCRRHAEGATLSFASAAAISMGRFALPVYEIYKVGEDLHWQPGLDLFRSLGLDLTILPHWNNNEGGSELDTSHCFMGIERFRYLKRMLPPENVILAIDEHTACILEPEENTGLVMGAGTARIIHGECEVLLEQGQRFSLDLLRD